MSRRAKWTVLALALAAACVFAASAFAGSDGTLCKVYCKKGSSVQQQVNGPFTPPSSNSQLPFTGLDLGFIALAGVALVLAGFGLHRVTRKPPEPPTN